MNDVKHGYGIFRWPDGGVYHGQWKEHKRDGYGYYKGIDGIDDYSQYKNHKRNGDGVQIENG
jgi:hypothetical protein